MSSEQENSVSSSPQSPPPPPLMATVHDEESITYGLHKAETNTKPNTHGVDSAMKRALDAHKYASERNCAPRGTGGDQPGPYTTNACSVNCSSSDGFVQSQNDVVDVVEEGKRVISEFLRSHKCYELIKNSGKVVVFDTRIPVNLAFFALVEHDIISAPLWNAEQRKFTGMITGTDFVNILRYFHMKGVPITEMAEFSIASWKAIPESEYDSTSVNNEMISISPEATLFDACKSLHQHRLRRLPIVDMEQNSTLAMLTHSSILEFLVTHFREQRRLFDQTAMQLGIGTFQNIISLPEDIPLIQVLHTLITQKIAAVPIVNSNGTVIDMYGISEVTELAKNHSIGQLDRPIIEIIRLNVGEANGVQRVHFCSPDDTLHILFEKFAATKANRLVCVDDFNRCVGVIALRDLFNYFLE